MQIIAQYNILPKTYRIGTFLMIIILKQCKIVEIIINLRSEPKMATTKKSTSTGKKSPGRPPKQTNKGATSSTKSHSSSKTSARATSSTASKSHSTRGRKSHSTTAGKSKSHSSHGGSAHQSFKMQAAREVGVSLKQGDNGHLTARQAGQIGGQMVKKMVQSYSNKTSK